MHEADPRRRLARKRVGAALAMAAQVDERLDAVPPSSRMNRPEARPARSAPDLQWISAGSAIVR
jgi:hypothetical protein